MSNQFDQRLYDRFQLIVNGPALFNAIVTGFEWDVFGVISRNGEMTLDQLVDALNVPRPQLRVLMLALCASELMSRKDARYSNSSLAEAFFVHDGPDSWKHILTGWQRIYYPAFQHMTTALTAGRNTALDHLQGEGDTLYERLTTQPELEGVLHRSMSAFTLQSMSGLVENADLTMHSHLLDVGGGDGTTAHVLAAHNPHLRISIFDVPSVAKRATTDIDDPVASRIAIVPGDFFKQIFPSGVDAVLFSHVLEIFDEQQIRMLLAKAFAVLPPGGKVMIYGFLSADDETAGVFGARLALYLNVLASGRGMAYPASDYEAAMRDVGFASVETIYNLPYEHGLTVGYRP